jgi:hypothetical protein
MGIFYVSTVIMSCVDCWNESASGICFCFVLLEWQKDFNRHFGATAEMFCLEDSIFGALLEYALHFSKLFSPLDYKARVIHEDFM